MMNRVFRIVSSRAFLQSVFALAALVLAESAEAHVKWFSTNFKPSEQPLEIGAVIAPTFVYLFLLSVVCIYAFFCVDRYCWKRSVLNQLDTKLKRLDGVAYRVIQVGAFLFFMALGLFYHGPSFYLTPELKTDAGWVMWFHMLIAACALSRRTAPITGFGILLLYGFSVRDYGMYHLLDYFIFLGIGTFLIVYGIERGQWRKAGFIALYAGVGLSLGWASIEKFAYPHWCDPLFAKDPGLLMGMKPYTYVVLAGFVEFNVTFILLGAASIVGRLVAMVLEGVFLLAVWRFGAIDAVGHLMIMAILVVLIVRGPTNARNMLVLSDKLVWTEAYFMTGLYTFAFVMIFTAYYGFHHLYYGN